MSGLGVGWAPPAWRELLVELHGGALLGEPGVRDVDAVCEFYEPIEVALGFGLGPRDCDTDGHFLCADGSQVCARISVGALRERREGRRS